MPVGGGQLCAPLAPVSGLSFACNNRLILVGRGSWVSAYVVATGELRFSAIALPNAVVHGFSFSPGRPEKDDGSSGGGSDDDEQPTCCLEEGLI